MPYFSVTRIVASSAPSSGSTSAISSPVANVPAVAASVDSVIGIGQNRPLVMRMPSHTPSQSARVMKPSSGVKPPMPSMTMSPRSRELTGTRGSVDARWRSRSRSPAASSSGFSSAPPWGGTRAFMRGRSMVRSGWVK